MSKQDKIYGVYIKSVLEKKVVLTINEIGSNIKEVLENKLSELIEGKCITEGYIKPKSIELLTHSSGIICTDQIEYNVVFECMICFPVEGQKVECVSKTITKAGIHAEVIDNDKNVPIHVFIAKDHHTMDSYFTSIREDMNLVVRVIGIRYELNDPYVCVIAKLLNPEYLKEDKSIKIKKKKIKIDLNINN